MFTLHYFNFSLTERIVHGFSIRLVIFPLLLTLQLFTKDTCNTLSVEVNLSMYKLSPTATYSLSLYFRTTFYLLIYSMIYLFILEQSLIVYVCHLVPLGLLSHPADTVVTKIHDWKTVIQTSEFHYKKPSNTWHQSIRGLLKEMF